MLGQQGGRPTAGEGQANTAWNEAFKRLAAQVLVDYPADAAIQDELLGAYHTQLAQQRAMARAARKRQPQGQEEEPPPPAPAQARRPSAERPHGRQALIGAPPQPDEARSSPLPVPVADSGKPNAHDSSGQIWMRPSHDTVIGSCADYAAANPALAQTAAMGMEPPVPRHGRRSRWPRTRSGRAREHPPIEGASFWTWNVVRSGPNRVSRAENMGRGTRDEWFSGTSLGR